MTELRALSLGQLSASAIAHGAKRIETRNWPAPDWIIGQQLVIHCSKTLPSGGLYGLQKWMEEEVNHQWLVEEGFMEPGTWKTDASLLPRGAILALATVNGCFLTEDLEPFVSNLEFSHGDYRPGRWGWCLTEVILISEPIPASGSMGLWKVSSHLKEQVMKRALEGRVVDGTRWHKASGSTNRPSPRRF